MTHGFVLDEQGRKMSKVRGPCLDSPTVCSRTPHSPPTQSLGNVVDPHEVVNGSASAKAGDKASKVGFA